MSDFITGKPGYPSWADKKSEPKTRILESFRWFSKDMAVKDATGKRVIIKGPALFSVEKFLDKGVSRNKRQYIQDELLRSARTLSGQELDVNHEITLWEEGGRKGAKPHGKGHVIMSEEEDGVLEYIAEVNDKEYSQKVLDTDKVHKGLLSEELYFQKWGKHSLEGVSVDADFHHLCCTVCGQKFTDPKLFEGHMVDVEHVKNFKYEPHLIHFSRLSLVEPPQSPGVIGANFEVLETGPNGYAQLLETLASNYDAIAGVHDGVLAEIVEKRGSQWCVVHCHGADAGKVIKCFDNEADAQAMHQAIMANKETVVLKDLPITDDQIRQMYGPVQAGILEDLAFLTKYPDSKVKEAAERLLTRADENILEAQRRAEVAEAKTGLKETVSERDALKETVESQTLKIQKLEEDKASLNVEITERDSLVETDKKLKTEDEILRGKLTETLDLQTQLTKKLEEEVSKSKGLAETNEKLQVQYDNLKDKMKGQFRGVAKQQNANKDPGASNWDPTKFNWKPS